MTETREQISVSDALAMQAAKNGPPIESTDSITEAIQRWTRDGIWTGPLDSDGELVMNAKITFCHGMIQVQPDGTNVSLAFNSGVVGAIWLKSEDGWKRADEVALRRDDE